MVRGFKGQNYGALKKKCLREGELFMDPEFPAVGRSLFHTKVDSSIQWKRPGELCKVPRLVVGGISSDDLNQGDLGNCWVVTACAGLAREPKMFEKAMPNLKEQEWGDDGKYAGIFHFQFWRYGDWIDVVVDDLLPTRDNKLVFCHSKSKNEFWSALLEKAYAKLYGTYEKLNSGYTSDCLVDFTGGVAEKIQLKDYESADEEKRLRLFVDMQDAVLGSSFVTTQIECPRHEMESEAGQGLIKGHGYTVTNVKDIHFPKALDQKSGKSSIRMIRLSNPWGTKEWTGPWSDNSPEWSQLSQKERNKLGIVFAKEGEFWMSFEDFLKNFTLVEICHIVNTSLFSMKKTWHETLFPGKWRQGPKGTLKDRCGGNASHPTFLINPQYAFDVVPDEDSIIISLEQNDNEVAMDETSICEIGFHIMKVEVNRKYRVHIPGDPVYVSDYVKSRNVFKRVPLKKGRYVLIPSTKDPGVTSEYLLRMYTTNKSGAKELIQHAPRPVMPCLPKVQLTTQVTAVKATGLEKKPNTTDPLNPYVVMKCEGEMVKGLHQKQTLAPTWETKAIFYRKKPVEKPIFIEVWNKKKVMDEFIGMAEVFEHGSEGNAAELEVDLYGKGKESKGKEKEALKPGKVTVHCRSTADLEHF